MRAIAIKVRSSCDPRMDDRRASPGGSTDDRRARRASPGGSVGPVGPSVGSVGPLSRVGSVWPSVARTGRGGRSKTCPTPCKLPQNFTRTDLNEIESCSMAMAIVNRSITDVDWKLFFVLMQCPTELDKTDCKSTV